MKKFKGTPGPWRARNQRTEISEYADGRVQKDVIVIDIQQDLTNQHITTLRKVEKLQTKTVADANLIAAAPELLELAFKFKADLLNMLHQSPARDNRIAQIDDIINKAIP